MLTFAYIMGAWVSGKMLKCTKKGMKELAFPRHDLTSELYCQFVFCQKLSLIKRYAFIVN